MRLFANCSGECWKCKYYICMAGHGDDDFNPATKEQLIYRLDSNEYPLHRSDIINQLKDKFNYDYTDEIGVERLMMKTLYDALNDISRFKWAIFSERLFGYDNYAILGEYQIKQEPVYLDIKPVTKNCFHVYSHFAGYIVFNIIILNGSDGNKFIKLESATNEGQYVYTKLDCELYRPIKSCFDEFLNSYFDSCSNPMDKYALHMKRVCEEFPKFIYDFIIYKKGIKL